MGIGLETHLGPETRYHRDRSQSRYKDRLRLKDSYWIKGMIKEKDMQPLLYYHNANQRPWHH